MRVMRYVICAFFLMGFSGLLVSSVRKDGISFRHLTVGDGLSQSSILAIHQDSRGFMWFGTFGGLNKYDGNTFTAYLRRPGDPGALQSGVIQGITETTAGELWISTTNRGIYRFDRETERFTGFLDPIGNDNPDFRRFRDILCDRSGMVWTVTMEGGLCRINPRTETLTRYRHDPDKPGGLGPGQVRTVYEDRSGALWVGTYGGGLYKFLAETETFTCYRHDPENPGSLPGDNVRKIFEDRSGMLWVSCLERGFARFDPGIGTFTRYTYDPESGDPDFRIVTVFYQDADGLLWLGTRENGLILFDPETGAMTSVRNIPGDPHSLSDDKVRSIYEDNSGLLWVGTFSGGVNIYDRKREKFSHHYHLPGNPDESGPDQVYPIYEDRSGGIWVGTGARGLHRWEPGAKKFTRYHREAGNPSSLSADNVYALCEDHDGQFWIGGGMAINKLDPRTGAVTRYLDRPEDPHSLAGGAVLSVLETEPGTLWFGATAGLYRMDTRDETYTVYTHRPDDPRSLGADFVYSLLSDKSGVLWVGTIGGGLNRFHPETGDFTRYVTIPGNPGSLGHNDVSCISETRDGMLWLGTDGGGFNKFDREKDIFTRYTTRDGLPNDVVYGILEDSRGNLWISTNRGISCFNPKTGIFKNYGPESGTGQYEYNSNGAFLAGDGKMYFGGQKGFTVFTPEDIEDNPHVPPVVITGFKLFNRPVGFGADSPLRRPVTETREITLSYRQNTFSFQFAALDYTNPRQNQYKYTLEGLHEQWIYLGNTNDIAFTGIEPGEYTLRVKGANNDGVWNEDGAAIRILITPPFWKTWWFRVLLLVLAAAMVVLWHRSRMNVLAVKLKTESQLSRFFEKSKVSNREQEIITLILKGKTNRDIEDVLYISSNTVRNHVYNIYRKLGVKTRLELVHFIQRSIKS